MENTNPSHEIKEAFKNIRYSLFIFSRKSFKGNIVLKDLISSKTYCLDQKSSEVGILTKDLFIGHLVNFKDKYYLLKGITIFPSDIISVLKKEARKVSKLKSLSYERDFLLNLTRLRNKWSRFGHILPQKIFQF